MKYDLPLLHGCYPKGGVSCSKDSFEVNGNLVFQIKFCGKSPALRVAAKRQVVKKLTSHFISSKIAFKISLQEQYNVSSACENQAAKLS
ncbi:MAG: hypothetical protein IPI23_20045 [Bacteroidetes bacterium]|nr:hypothetical protein [Bacteroidota bacterium]